MGAAAGKLTGSQGRPQTGFSVRRFPTPLSLSFEVLGLDRIWPANPVNRRYRCLDLNLEAPADVEQPIVRPGDGDIIGLHQPERPHREKDAQLGRTEFEERDAERSDRVRGERDLDHEQGEEQRREMGAHLS